MNKVRFAGVVFVCLILLAGLYALWPSASGIGPRLVTHTSTEKVQRPDISQESSTPSETTFRKAGPGGVGVITGEVFALDGSRVADADVSIRYIDAGAYTGDKRVAEPVVTAKTDESGDFAATGLALGTYVISVRSGDLSGANSALIDRYRPTNHVTVLLRSSTPALAGTVVGTDDAPVIGARVMLVMHDGEDLRGSMQPVWEAETDNAGAFSFERIEPGNWRAYVTAEGYAPLLTGELKAGDKNARIVMTQGGSLGGTALWAETNAPAAGVALKARFKGVSHTEPFTATVEPSGRFTFERLVPGKHEILPEDKTLVPVDGAVRVEVVEGKPITDLVVRIAEGGIVRGRVFDATTQEGVGGILVTANAADPAAPLPWIQAESIEGSGDYEIKGLSAGEYTLDTFSSNGYHTQLSDRDALKFESAPGAVVEGKDIPVCRGVGVAGVVTDADDNPVPYVKVRGRGARKSPEVYTDESGQFEIWDFSEGDSICLRAEGGGWRSEIIGYLEVPANGISDLQLTLNEKCDAAMAGTVVDAAGNPTAAVVVCTEVNLVSNPLEDARRYEQVGSDGTFLLTNLPPGDYTLGLGPNYGTGALREVVSSMTLHLDPEQVRSGLRLVYDDSNIVKISGRVTDSEGDPIFGVSIHTTDADGAPEIGHTNKDGEYNVPNVGRGPITAWVTHHQYARQTRKGIEPGATNVDFVLASPGRISGQVIDAATGQPIVNYDITEHPRNMPQSFRHISDNEGRFSFTATTQIGEFLVNAPGYSSARLPLRPSIKAGESCEGIVIELTAGYGEIVSPPAPAPIPTQR